MPPSARHHSESARWRVQYAVTRACLVYAVEPRIAVADVSGSISPIVIESPMPTMIIRHTSRPIVHSDLPPTIDTTFHHRPMTPRSFAATPLLRRVRWCLRALRKEERCALSDV